MASNFVKPNKMMRRMETKKSHSWWWDSHISSKNSKWLQENLDEMDHHVKRMLKLIEEDADSFAKKAEMYYQKRPELITLVEDFYRMYRSLAERYDNVTGELRKNIPSDLQSQSSGISDVGSEPPSSMPSPDRRPSHRKSGPRAAGFDFFLGNGKSGDGDESSTLDSESESDDSSVNNYSAPHSNSDESQRKIIELEIELREVKEKLRMHDEEEMNYKKSGDAGNFEVNNVYEEELRVAKEKIQLSEDEIARLATELHKYESLDSDNLVSDALNKIKTLEDKVASLNEELVSKGSTIQHLQNELKSAQKEVTVWKKQVEKEKREVSRLQDRMTRYKNNVSDRDQEIRGLKESISNANKTLSEENKQLEAEMTRLLKERAYLEDSLKEMDLRCQSLEQDVQRKTEMEVILKAKIEQVKKGLDALQVKYETERDDLNMKIEALGVEVSSKDDEIDEISERLHQLHKDHVELVAVGEGTRKKIRELEREVESKQEIILQGAEEKREAIRQLCFSLEHYRNGYQRLREVVMGHKGTPIVAT